MDAALSTVLGVVAGGVITYVSQRGLDNRRERRERQREERTDERAAGDLALTTKAGARLVYMDLLAMFTALRSSRDVKRWWIEMLLPTAAWLQYREHLCRVLGDQAFRRVGSTFAGAEHWNTVCQASRRYYWVKPHISLRPDEEGMSGMRDTLIQSSARALLELAALGFGTLEDDDPMLVMIRAEIDSLGATEDVAARVADR